MTRLSTSQKEALVNQYLNSDLSLREFAKLNGVSKSTLYTWCKQFPNNANHSMSSSSNFSGEQRFAMVLETALFSELELSQYCREKGLYPEQIQQWKHACIQATAPAVSAPTAEQKSDKKRIKVLEKELNRKEKALAETAALLVLRKKFNAQFGLEEES